PALVHAIQIGFQDLQRIVVHPAFARQSEQLRQRQIGQPGPLQAPLQHLAIHLTAVVLQAHQQKAGANAGGILLCARTAIGTASRARAELLEQGKQLDQEGQIAQHEGQQQHDRCQDELYRDAPQDDQDNHHHQYTDQHQQQVELLLSEGKAQRETPQPHENQKQQRQNQQITNHLGLSTIRAIAGSSAG